MPSPVGGINSIREGQITRMSITDYQNEYLTLSALGGGVAPAGTFIKTAPMTL